MAPPDDSRPVAEYIMVAEPDGPLIREIMQFLFTYIGIPDREDITELIGSIEDVTAVHMIFYVSDTWDDIPVIMPQSSESDDASDETVLNDMD